MTPEWLTDIAYRVRRFFGRRRADEDMANELAAHIELETEQLIRAGLAPDEARRQARLSFGGVEQVKEAARDAWGIRTADVVVGRAVVEHESGVPLAALEVAVALAGYTVVEATTERARRLPLL